MLFIDIGGPPSMIITRNYMQNFNFFHIDIPLLKKQRKIMINILTYYKIV